MQYALYQLAVHMNGVENCIYTIQYIVLYPTGGGGGGERTSWPLPGIYVLSSANPWSPV